MITEAIRKVIEGNNLAESEMIRVMEQIMSGEETPQEKTDEKQSLVPERMGGQFQTQSDSVVHNKCPKSGDNSLFSPGARFTGRQESTRSTRVESLLAETGESVLEKLLANCALVVIDDADLRPQDLQGHRAQTSLSTITALEMTKALGLKGGSVMLCYTRLTVLLIN